MRHVRGANNGEKSMKCHSCPSQESRPRTDACLVPFGRDESGKVVPLFEDGFLDRSAHHALAARDFRAKEGEVLFLYPDPVTEDRIVLVGCGDIARLTLDAVRAAFIKAASALSARTITSICCLSPQVQDVPLRAIYKAVLEGLYLGSYAFTEYKTKKEDDAPGITELTVVTQSPHVLEEVERDVRSEMDAVALARNLVNRNADTVTPEEFASVALSLATKDLAVTVHGPKWIEKERMGLLLAVARGARYEPRVVIVEWKGNPRESDTTVLVGKGITFDTGGLNIKSDAHMLDMKSDMAGAAAVLAVMQAVRDLRLPLNISAVIPLCENAIGPHAYKPGDVFKARSGKTVEIISTDAEGRLILADALHYVSDVMKPSRIIDVATLTGSAEVALGNDVSALFSNTDSLSILFERAAHHTGDHVWRLPLHQPYEKLLDSEIADCKNVASRKGGAINAALFLSWFVGDTPWAHLDVAGTAYLEEKTRYYGKGATGIPVRLLIELSRSLLPGIIPEVEPDEP